MKKIIGYTILTAFLIIMALNALSIFAGIYRHTRDFNEKDKLTKGAQIGWSEQKVIESLGKPALEVDSLDKVIDKRSWLPIPTRKVSYKLLAFNLTFWRIYVYIDKDNNVEFTQLSRT